MSKKEESVGEMPTGLKKQRTDLGKAIITTVKRLRWKQVNGSDPSLPASSLRNQRYPRSRKQSYQREQTLRLNAVISPISRVDRVECCLVFSVGVNQSVHIFTGTGIARVQHPGAYHRPRLP